MGAERAINVAEPAVADGDPVRHLMTVDEFLVLDGAGAFDDLGRVQLIDGEVFVMNAVHRPHAIAQSEILAAFVLALRALKTDLRAPNLRAYAPVSTRLDDHSLPEPDVLVATVESDLFVSKDSVRLAVEVSSSTLDFDLGKKARLYARTGVPEYWVVDVQSRQIIRMAGSVGDTYTQRDVFAWGERVEAVTIPGLVIDTTHLV